MEITNQPITGQEKPEDPASPIAAIINFYTAFNNKNHELMEQNWLQSDEASMSNPLGGIKRGWNEISEVYQKIFNGDASVYVEFYDYSIHTTEHMFIAVGKERGVLVMNSGKKIKLAIRTSLIYQLHNKRWKQIHHHGSMDNPQLLSTYQSTLLKK